MNKSFVRLVCRALMVCMSAFPFSIHAGMIDTGQIAAAAHATTERDKVRNFMSRSEVRAQLKALGVGADAAQARVNAMTDAEVASIAGRIDELPAGGYATLAVAAALLVIILIWDNWVK